MPEYPIKCPCGFQGDVFGRFSDVDDEGRLECPSCHQRAPQDYLAKTIRDPNTVFGPRQQWSIEEGWNPRTAREAAQMMGPEGNCIDVSTGRVRFTDRREQQAYARKLDALKARGAELYKQKRLAAQQNT